ncbi:hypothetical protein ACRAWD_07625 [Caulobacter segnis]
MFGQPLVDGGEDFDLALHLFRPPADHRRRAQPPRHPDRAGFRRALDDRPDRRAPDLRGVLP